MANEKLRLDLSAGRDHLDSNIDVAIFRRNALGISGQWSFLPHWKFLPQAQWFSTNYKVAHPTNDEEDVTRILALGLTYSQGKYELGWRIERFENDSPFDVASYKRTVAECILTYMF